MNTCRLSSVFSFPGIMENSVNCHRKLLEFYYQISVGNGNPTKGPCKVKKSELTMEVGGWVPD